MKRKMFLAGVLTLALVPMFAFAQTSTWDTIQAKLNRLLGEVESLRTEINTLAPIQGAAIGSATTDITAPTVPQNLTAARLSANQIRLSWSASTDDANQVAYRLYRNGENFWATGATSYTDTIPPELLTSGVTLTYTVRAYDASPARNTSVSSNSATPGSSVTPAPNPNLIPATIAPPPSLIPAGVNPPPTPVPTFQPGDAFKTTARVNVRREPQTTATSFAEIPKNTVGTITGGPLYEEGYYWWSVKFNSPAVKGYIVQNYIVKDTSLTIVNSPSVPAQNIAVGAPNQILGGFTVINNTGSYKYPGTPSLIRLVFNVATTGSLGNSALITSATLLDENGTVIAGPVDQTVGFGGYTTLNFINNTINFPPGTHSFTVRGKVSANTKNGTRITLTTFPSNLTDHAIVLSTMTVGAGGGLTVSIPDTAPRMVQQGGGDQAFAEFRLDATQSAEDIRISSLNTLHLGVLNGGIRSHLSVCRMYDGAIPLNNNLKAVSPTDSAANYSFVFDSATTTVVSKGTVKTLVLKCFVNPLGAGTYHFDITGSTTVSAIGFTSGASVNVTKTVSEGPYVSINSRGALSITLDPSSPPYQIVSAGSVNQTMSVLKVSAINEPIRLDSITLQGSQYGLGPSWDSQHVTVWDGATKLGDAFFAGPGPTTFIHIGGCNDCSQFIVPANGSKLLTVKADIARQGVGEPGTPGALVTVDFNNDGITQGIGMTSGRSITPMFTGNTHSAGVRVFKSFPTISTIPTPGNLTGGFGRTLHRFRITADPRGAIGIYSMTVQALFTASNPQSTIRNITIYGYTDANFSQHISGVSPNGALNPHSQETPIGPGNFMIPINVVSESLASSTVVIPAGQTRYFEVRGDVSIVGTQNFLTTSIVADSINLSPTLQSVAQFTRLPNSMKNFVWTPFSTTTLNDMGRNDFTNGYGVDGLPTYRTILSN